MFGSVPSLTLLQSGNDRSTIKCHLPVDPFRIAPKWFTIHPASDRSSLNGPSTLPEECSFCRYLDAGMYLDTTSDLLLPTSCLS